MPCENEWRIFGPPGTGKTTWLARQIRHAAARYSPDNVLAASFTKVAALELRGRDLPIPSDRVGTLHSICYHALGGHLPIAETKPWIESWNEAQPGFALSGATSESDVDEPFGDERVGEREGDRLLRLANVYRARLLPEEHWPMMAVRAFWRRWCDWKTEHGLIDFTDMIERALQEIPVAPGDPRVGCFDEVQDFTALELSVCRQWAGHMEYVLLVGDDDQSIFSFKGCDARAFLEPPIPDERKIPLKQSYRVPAVIHRLASRWISGVSRRERKIYQPRDADGEVTRMPDDVAWGNAEAVVDRLLVDYDRYDDTASAHKFFLLTSCAYMLRDLQDALRQAGVPFHNPFRRKRRDWNPLWSGGRDRLSILDRLMAYLRPLSTIWGRDARMWTVEDVQAWLPLLRSEGVLQRGAKMAVARMDKETRERTVTLDELEQWFDPPALAASMQGSVTWLLGHALSDAAQKLRYPAQILKRFGGRVLREPPKVVIGTIHSTKGAECDEAWLFPDLSPSGAEEWEQSVEGRDAIIRQFYVGMTRARERLVLCAPNTRNCVEL